MKKITKIIGVFAFTAFLGLSNPVVAQSTDGGTTTTQTAGDDDDGDDQNNWGLAGLLGLLGLLGLKKKDDHVRTTTTNR